MLQDGWHLRQVGDLGLQMVELPFGGPGPVWWKSALGCAGAHRPPYPLAGQRRHRSRPASWSGRRRPRGSTSSRSPTTTPRRAGTRPAAAAEAGHRLVRGIEISTNFRATACTCSPTCRTRPTRPGRRARPHPRRPRRPAARDAGPAARARHRHRPRTRRRVAGDAAATGRPHVADALVRDGVVPTATRRSTATSGRTARPTSTVTPPTSSAMIRAGRRGRRGHGVAHPWGRPGRSARRGCARRTGRRRACPGIEVDHQDHSPDVREQLRAIARDLDLVVTGSSDHHGTGKVDHHLGCNTTAPDQLERLLERAADAAAAAGRARWAPLSEFVDGVLLAEVVRDALRDHGPGRHGPDLPLADRGRPEASDAPGGAGRRSPSRSW